MSKNLKIRFIKEAVVRVYGYIHPDNPVYKAGDILEVNPDSARRWLKRGVAELVEEKVAEAKKVVKEAVKEDDDKVQTKVAKEPSSSDGNNSGDGDKPDNDSKRKSGPRSNQRKR